MRKPGCYCPGFFITFGKKFKTNMECLEKLIGITDTDCECIIGGLDETEIAAVRESKSGLFLDELEGGVNMRAIDQLDSCKNFADMALGARDTAAKKLYGDVLVALSNRYKTGKNVYRGFIGRPSYTANLPVTRPWQFMRLRSIDRSDAMMKLTGLRIIVDRAATVTVKIIKAIRGGNQGTELLSVNVLTVPNAYVPVPLPAEFTLPLTEEGDSIDYYIAWDRSVAGGVNPKDLKIDCNCGGGKGYETFLDVAGGQLDDLNFLTGGQTDKYSHGITLDVDIRCVPGNLICREYDRENAIAVTLAWAMMYKAWELLIEAVMNSGEVNRYTMMNREYLWGKRSHFRKEYETRITYLASVMDVSSSDCFICRENRIFMGGIIS